MSPIPARAHAPNRDLSDLAPKMREAVEAALAECEAAGLDAMVFEAHRSNERQAWLYAQGRTRPGSVVTHARGALRSWHFYGLAVDVISRSRGWDQPRRWWDQVGAIFERHDLAWGGRWKFLDLPHFQWGRCAQSPRHAPTLLTRGGVRAVWHAVGAI